MTTNWNAPTCTACRGTGVIVLTGKRASSWIEVNCRDCHGRGHQGPPPVPKTPDPDHRPPVGQHPAVITSGLCTRCLGAGELISLTGATVRTPCPDCSKVLNVVKRRRANALTSRNEGLDQCYTGPEGR